MAFRAALLVASVASGALGMVGCEPTGGLSDDPTDTLAASEAYYLPYEAGRAHLVAQADFGPWSHESEYAIDFVMPEGTAILAARSGVVKRVIDDCPDVNCPFAPETCCANLIEIGHVDGSIARYLHLPPGGSCVVEGQAVSRGDVIGDGTYTDPDEQRSFEGAAYLASFFFAIKKIPPRPATHATRTATAPSTALTSSCSLICSITLGRRVLLAPATQTPTAPSTASTSRALSPA